MILQSHCQAFPHLSQCYQSRCPVESHTNAWLLLNDDGIVELSWCITRSKLLTTNVSFTWILLHLQWLTHGCMTFMHKKYMCTRNSIGILNTYVWMHMNTFSLTKQITGKSVECTKTICWVCRHKAILWTHAVRRNKIRNEFHIWTFLQSQQLHFYNSVTLPSADSFWDLVFFQNFLVQAIC